MNPYTQTELNRKLAGHRPGETKLSHVRETCDLCRWADTLEAAPTASDETVLTQANNAIAALQRLTTNFTDVRRVSELEVQLASARQTVERLNARIEQLETYPPKAAEERRRNIRDMRVHNALQALAALLPKDRLGSPTTRRSLAQLPQFTEEEIQEFLEVSRFGNQGARKWFREALIRVATEARKTAGGHPADTVINVIVEKELSR